MICHSGGLFEKVDLPAFSFVKPLKFETTPKKVSAGILEMISLFDQRVRKVALSS